MRALWMIAARSAWHRRFSLGLVVMSIALSTLLLLSVERLREDVRRSFSNAVSGTDLIVGGRTGSVQLLLYAVFRIGQVPVGMGWRSVEMLEKDPAVAWVVPLSLGDSHRGFPGVGTTEGYFEHFRYGRRLPLAFAEGGVFDDEHDAVIGAEVARKLGLTVGAKIVLAHGDGALEANDHGEHPFTVVGVLKPTGTPVDRSVHVSLDALDELHPAGLGGMPAPRRVTAALVGLKSRSAVFGVQQRVTSQGGEALMAILPGVVLDELWDTVGAAEQALLLMGLLVATVSLAGLVAAVATALEQRRRELAVLRSVGAGPGAICALLTLEGTLLGACGAALGLVAWAVALVVAGPWAQAHYGVTLSTAWPGTREAMLMAAVVAAAAVASLLPGWRAYRLSLADGLQPRG